METEYEQLIIESVKSAGSTIILPRNKSGFYRKIGNVSADGQVIHGILNGENVIVKLMFADVNNISASRNIVIDTFCCYYLSHIKSDVLPKIYHTFAVYIARVRRIFGYIIMEYGGESFEKVLPRMTTDEKKYVISQIFDNLLPKLHKTGIHHSDFLI